MKTFRVLETRKVTDHTNWSNNKKERVSPLFFDQPIA